MDSNLMSQITHREAHRLINFKADQALDANTGSILETHLNGCPECRGYASELDELENLLRKMKHGFDLRPTPLHLDHIQYRSKESTFGFPINVMVTRITTMVVAFIAVAIVGWQFFSASIASPAAPYTAIPIPTPSTYLTATQVNVLFRNCGYLSYQVKTDDTLNGIARQFSVPVKMIMELNGIKDENINPSMQIKIPVCDHTPTVTIDAPNSTITITPQFEPNTPTPG